MRWRAAVLAAGTLMVGCKQPCYRLCEERAEAFGACLEPWYLSWGAFEVDSKDEYVQLCEQATDAERLHLSKVARAQLDDACDVARDAHRVAADCDAQWAAFEASAESVP